MKVIRWILAIILGLVGLFFIYAGISGLTEISLSGAIILIVFGVGLMALAVLAVRGRKPKKDKPIEKQTKDKPKAIEKQDKIKQKSEKIQPAPQVQPEQCKLSDTTYRVSGDLYHRVVVSLDASIHDVMQINDLTPQELAVMYKVQGREIGTSREYWLDNAGVDVVEAANHYIAHGYATYYPLDPWDKTVVELKDMLRAKGAKISGTKDDLVDRVWEVYSTEELIELNPEKRIKLTDKGFAAMEATPYTMLRNHVVEHDCLALIVKGDYAAAQRKAADYLAIRQAQAYPVDSDRFDRLQQMHGFDDDVKDAIYNAMQILAYIVTGNEHTPMIYIESWIPDYQGTDKETNDKIDAEFLRVMEGYGK